MSARLKEELKIIYFEMNLLVCEWQHGPLLGEDVSEDGKNERLVESLMDFEKSTCQLMVVMIVKTNDTKGCYIFETRDLFMIAGFVADDGQSFEAILEFDEGKYDEESLSNEERSKVLKQMELIDEFLDGGTQSIGADLKMKEEK